MLQYHIKLATIALLSTIATFNFTGQHFWLPQPSGFRFHNNEPIELKPGSYEALIARWEKRLNNSWNGFYQKLESEVGLFPEQLEALVQDKTLANIYNTLKEKQFLEISETMDENNIDPDVLMFVQRILQKYCTKKNIKIIISSNINTITATFGCDEHTHYLICHANFYTPEHIQSFYENFASSNGIFYIEPLKNNTVRAVELSNLLLIGLIEAASHIQNESNFLTFLISNLKFSEQKLSQKTIETCWNITETKGIIESIFQSKNPLESALFIGKTRKRTKKEHDLWKKLINEIADCYEPRSLNFFKASIEEIRSNYKA